jgi:ferric-dicitrate binding protein FerR (iron transport regulator)
MEKIAASDMNPQAKQAAFDRLSAEFHKNAEAYSQAVKAKRKTNEAGANNPPQAGTNVPSGPTTNPADAKKALAATSQLKAVTGSQAPADRLMKALDSASQGKAVGAQDMTALEPIMNVVGSAFKDPKLANQFKSLANQANQMAKQETQPGQQP